MSESSIRIKLGPVEIDCTASETYLTEELPKLFDTLTRLYAERLSGIADVTRSLKDSAGNPAPGTSEMNNGSQLGINTIVARLKSKSGSDLLLAAAFVLTRNGSTGMKRGELLAEMKKSTIWKATFSNNLSKSFETLVGDSSLLDRGADTYGLNPETLKRLEVAIAGSGAS